MFSKPLVGTPRPRDALRHTAVDFTPLGRRAGAPAGAAAGGPPEVDLFSSFDRTDDFMDTTEPFVPSAPAASAPARHPGDILSVGGVTSIKQQQMASRRLETENYNLKIKLATLTKYLSQTPEDQRHMLNQNVELKLQLMEAAREMAQLKLEVARWLAGKENQTALRRDLAATEAAARVRALTAELEDARALYAALERRHSELREKASGQQLEREKASHGQLREIQELRERLEAAQEARADAIRDGERTRLQMQAVQSQLQLSRRENDELRHERQRQSLDLERQLEVALQEAKRDAARVRQEVEEERRRVNDAAVAAEEAKQDAARARHEALRAAQQLDEERRRLKATAATEEAPRVARQLEEEQRRLAAAVAEAQRDAARARRDAQQAAKQLEEERLKAAAEARHAAKQLDAERMKASVAAAEAQRAAQELEDVRTRLQAEARMWKAAPHETDRLEEVRSLRSQVEDLKFANEKLQRRAAAAAESAAEAARLEQKVTRLTQDLQDKELQELRLQTQIKALEHGGRDGASLQAELDDLRQQLRSLTDVDEQILKLLRENREINDKLDFYEQEYASLETAMQAAESEKELLAIRVAAVERENMLLMEQLRRAREASHGGALGELEAFNRRKLESEKRELQAEVEALKRDLTRVVGEMNARAAPATPVTPSNYHSFDREDELRELHKKTRRLESMVSERDATIEALEDRIREMDRFKRRSAMAEDDAKADLMQLKLAQASQIKALQLENEKLQREFEAEIDYYKKLARDGPTVALLERQLKDAGEARAALEAKLGQLAKDNEQLEAAKRRLDDTVSQLERQKSDLEAKVARTRQDLDRVTEDCAHLANKVRQMKRPDPALQYENAKLQRQLAEVNAREAAAPSKELVYYKARLHDVSVEANDLRLVNDMLRRSSANATRHTRRDLVRLTGSGVYPDYAKAKPRAPRLTLKVLATCVLAAVRMRRRLERAEKRRLQLFELKTDIERARRH